MAPHRTAEVADIQWNLFSLPNIVNWKDTNSETPVFQTRGMVTQVHPMWICPLLTACPFSPALFPSVFQSEASGSLFYYMCFSFYYWRLKVLNLQFWNFIFIPQMFFFFNFNFFSFIFISWRLISLQYCSGFCHTLTWISHGFTCIPHPDPKCSKNGNISIINMKLLQLLFMVFNVNIQMSGYQSINALDYRILSQIPLKVVCSLYYLH